MSAMALSWIKSEGQINVRFGLLEQMNIDVVVLQVSKCGQKARHAILKRIIYGISSIPDL